MNTINLNSPQAEQQIKDSSIPAAAQPQRPTPGAPVPPPPPAPRNRMGGQPAPDRRPAPQTAGNDTGKKVAVGLGAAAVAGGATAATMSAMDSDGEISLDDQIIDAASQVAVQTGQPEPEQPAAPAGNAGGNNSGSQAPAGNGGQTPGDTIPEPEIDPIPDPEPDPEIDPAIDPAIDPTIDPTEIEDPEDIDAIADSLIAQDQIDPDDIEDEDIFTFNGIETVYTVEGDEEVHASFTSNTGYDLVMIDIDNDGLFDKIETTDGMFVDDATQFGLTVSDAENMVQGEGYLAQSDAEIDNFDQELGDDYLDDIITV